MIIALGGPLDVFVVEADEVEIALLDAQARGHEAMIGDAPDRSLDEARSSDWPSAGMLSAHVLHLICPEPREAYRRRVDFAWVLAAGFDLVLHIKLGALRMMPHMASNSHMGRPAHPMRDRALRLMRRGLATPGEIARAGGIAPALVHQWRRRAGITIDGRRLAHVRDLLMRGESDGNGIKRPSEAVHADREAVGPV